MEDQRMERMGEYEENCKTRGKEGVGKMGMNGRKEKGGGKQERERGWM